MPNRNTRHAHYENLSFQVAIVGVAVGAVAYVVARKSVGRAKSGSRRNAYFRMFGMD